MKEKLKIAGIIISAGSRVVNRHEVGRNLWKRMAALYCLNGSEITYHRRGELPKLEQTQNTVDRWDIRRPTLLSCRGNQRGDGLEYI